MPPTPPGSVLPFLQEASAGTGLPLGVVEAQNFAESAYGSNIGPSSAGAEGPWQFLPSTYASVGGAPGGINSWGPSTHAYITYMNQLLGMEGGSIFKALEAYNAGPGNLGAGAGYASGILSSAGVSSGATSGPKGKVPPGSLSAGMLTSSGGGVGGIINTLTDPFGALFGDLATAFGVGSIKDLFQRAGLIILGGILIIVGLAMLESRAISSIINVTSPPPEPREPESETSNEASSSATDNGSSGTIADSKGTSPEFRKQYLAKSETLSSGTTSLASKAVDSAIVA